MKTYYRSLVLIIFLGCLIKSFFLAHQEFLLSAQWVSSIEVFASRMLSDFMVIAIIGGLGWITSRVKRRVIQGILAFLAGVFSFFYLLETVVLLLFHLELTVLTVSSLAQDAFTFFPWLVWGGIAAVIAVFCGLAFLLSRRQAYLFTSKFPSFCLGFFCIIVILGVLCGISSPLPANMFITNGKILFARLPEVEDFHLFGKHTTYQDYFHSVKGKQHRPNIILLFAESLSPIDSLRIGGVHDNLPNFDRISADGMTFTNFVNNGCTSDTAHVAMLRGIEPLGKASYTGFQTILESLPEFLKTQGYSTTFLSAVSLDFFGQKGFLEAMDFDEIIGEEAFEDRKKYVFDAAPDGDLYEKALEILKKKQKEYQADAPYALLLQSISYHKPYSTPYGETEESSIKYSDEMLGNFYDSLKKSGFFEDGILIIVGDHRKMTAETKGEKDAIGDMRHARGLATVVGTGIIPGSTQSNVIQDTDFFYGLRSYLSTGKVLVSELYNDPFDSKTVGRKRGFMHDNCSSERAYSLVLADGQGTYSRNVQDLYEDSSFANYFPLYLQFQQGKYSDSTCTSQQIIAHAGGEIAGLTYTNTLEALNLSYAKGARLFELDLLETSDGKLIAGHDWEMIKKRAHYATQDDTPLSEAEFLALQPYQPLAFRSYQLYTPLNMKRINQRFTEHPDTILVTDKLNDPRRLAQELTFTGRVMMELFSWEAVEAAKKVGIIPMPSENLLINTPNVLQKLQDEEIAYLAVSRRLIDSHASLLEEVKHLGIKVYVFHVNFDEGKDESRVLEHEMEKNGSGLVYGMYADNLGKVMECLYPEV